MQVIQKFSTMEEVIDRANKNNYGLAAAVFTKDVSNALFMSNRLMVMVMVLVMVMVMVTSWIDILVPAGQSIFNCCPSQAALYKLKFTKFILNLQSLSWI